jgi:hypothetical protein
MIWCCPGFESHVGFGGERGLSIVVDSDLRARPQFFIQYRAVDLGTEASIRLEDGVPVTLAGQTGLLFCPWCGRDLAVFYESEASAIARPDLVIRAT